MRFPEFTKEWKKKALGDIGEAIIGLTYSPFDVVPSDGTIVFRSSNIQDGQIDYSDLVRVSKNIKEKIITLENDILVCARNGSARLIGKNAILKQSDAGNTFGAFMMVYRSSDNPFIHPMLSTRRYFRQVGENLGARINQITTSDFNGFEFFFPRDEAERRKIAKIFSLLDERIATQNKIIEKYESLIQAMCDTLIERETQQVALSFSDFGQSYSGLSGKNAEDFGDGYPFITYMNVYQNQIIDSTDIGLVKIIETEQQSVVRYGDILFTLSSETPEEVGMGAVYLDETYPLYLNSFCFGIHITDETKIYSPFLAYYVSSQSFRKAVYPLAQGSTRFNLPKSDFMKKQFSFPVIEKQRIIYSILKTYSDKLIVEKQIMRLLCNQKCYLLRQLFI